MQRTFFCLFSALLLTPILLFAAEPNPFFPPAMGEAEFKKLRDAVRADAGALERELGKSESLEGQLLAAEYDPVMSLAMEAMEKKPSPRVALLLTGRFSREASRVRFSGGEERQKFNATGYERLRRASEYLEKADKSDLSYPHAVEELTSAVADAALESGKLDEAKAAAEKLLKNNTATKDWNYGNLVHEGHSVLGRVAIRQGDMASARRHLIAAGKTPGSPQLNSFGPDFSFAREMLEKGEKEVVLEYLDLVGKFWGTVNPRLANNPNSVRVAEQNAAELKGWKAQINEGKIPRGGRWR